MDARARRSSLAARTARWQWLALAVLAFAAPESALAFDAAELMSMMAKIERSSVAFEETKHIAALAAPLMRKGTLSYIRPDQLEMQVAEPYFERLEIAGERLTIETRKGKRQIDLAAQPLAAAWIESLRATLSGDLTGLGRYYSFQLVGQRERWKLALRPLDRSLAGIVDRIEISGGEAQIERIAIEETQGDRTMLVLSPQAPAKP